MSEYLAGLIAKVSAWRSVHFNHVCIHSGRIKLSEAVHYPTFMGVHLLDQDGWRNISGTNGRNHDKLMGRMVLFAPITIVYLELYHLTAEQRLTRDLRTAGHVAVQD